MAKGDQIITLDKMFTKGLYNNFGDNKTPDHYAERFINLRIKNGGITARRGQELLFNGNNTNPVQGITSNAVTNKLLVVQNGSLRHIIIGSPTTQSVIGSISYTGKVRFINYGIYTIILTGTGFPWVYNNTTLFQTTSSNIPVNVNPSFGIRYAGFTVVNSNLNPNVIYISRPITLANQERCYERLGTGAETITFDTRVLGFSSTLNYLWIFTRTSIEYISRDNLTNIGGVQSLFTIPIAPGDELLNPDCVVNANEYIFYITKNLRIKSINYVQGNPTPQVAVISEQIDAFLRSFIHEEQTDAFASYDKNENLVKFHLRSKQSSTNDIVVIWDLNNQTRLLDNNKYYNGMTQFNEKYYASNAFVYKIYIDEEGLNDENDPVEREYLSAPLSIGNPTIRKQYRGCRIAGKINKYAIIDWEFLVDDTVVMDKQIVGNDIVTAGGGGVLLGIGGVEIGGHPIGGPLLQEYDELVPFEQVATQGAIRATGKNARIRLSGGQFLQKFIIDYADITVRPRMRELISDKV